MEDRPVADKIQIRRDTAANWTSANPTLAQGELGLETDTGKLKAGTGSTAWTSLGYYSLGVISSGITLTNANLTGTTSIEEVIEKVTTATSTTGTINFDAGTSAVQYYTANQTANRTINFRASSSATLNSIMAIGESMSFAILMAQGSTAYYLNVYQVDGTGITPKWQGGTAPSAGNASSTDSYSFTIIKTADATFTVFASQTQFT
jgi:hypothetical protein|tara:strand:+ start:275 stop:892 length:618 start_codon:yes stop_codon:yes gene_type:complete